MTFAIRVLSSGAQAAAAALAVYFCLRRRQFSWLFLAGAIACIAAQRASFLPGGRTPAGAAELARELMQFLASALILAGTVAWIRRDDRAPAPRNLSDPTPIERALRESETRWRTLVEQLPACVWTTDREMRYTNSQGAGLAKFGLKPGQLVGKTIFDYLGTSDPQDPVIAAFYRALDGEALSFHSERQGGVFHISIAPLHDGDSAIIGCIGMALDVTAQVRAEQALCAAEERFRTFIDNNPIIVVMKDEQGRYVYGNKKWAMQFGKEPHELIGKFDADIWSPDEVRQFRQNDLLVMRDGQPREFIQQGRTPDGRLRSYLSHKFLMNWPGDQPRICSVSAEITDRIEAEEKLKKSQASLAAAQRVAQIGNWDWNIESNELYWSDELFRIFGLPSGNFGTTYESFLRRVHPDDQEGVARTIEDAVLNPKPFTIENRIIRPDGAIRVIYSNAEVMTDAAGKAIRMVGTAQDVTERRALEDQLRQSQKMEAIGQLAGGIAHDFNNMLTAIIGYGVLLNEQFDAADPRRKGVEMMLHSADRAAALTRQLLAFSRNQTLRPVVLDLNHLLGDLERMLRRVIGEDIDLVTVSAADLGRVKADRSQIEQVVINLAVNARDAMPAGGKLTIETANVNLDESNLPLLTGALPGRYVMIAVTDTGIGMDRQTLERIFEPFFTTKEVGRGTGLGLSTAYGIVKQSGGFIRVESEPGRGSTFRIYLPQVEEALAKQSHGNATRWRRGTETVLVAEDDRQVRLLACEVLRRAGYLVHEATSAAEALAICERASPLIDLLLTDVVMRNGNGRELAETLRQNHPKLRVLYMSGYTNEAVVRHGVSQDDKHFLQKPFTPQLLTQKVRAVLDDAS